MKHVRTRRFKKAFEKLSREIQEKAVKQFELFRDNPGHRSLRIEPVEGTNGVWSGRVDDHYRWTFHYEDDPKTGKRTCVHRVIGTHEVYENP